MPDNTKKISQLTTITAAGINAADLIVVTDVSASISSKITFENVTNAVLSDANIEAKAPVFVTKLNAINGSTPSLSNGLNSGGLYYSGAYRDGAYFLNYSNITNPPTLATDITDLTNTTNYISFDSTQLKMRVNGTLTNGATDLTMTSDYIDEGPTVNSNKFYTDQRVDTRVTATFGGLFNQYSDTFDGGKVIDSLTDVPATFRNVGGDFTSSMIRVTDTTIVKNFSVGQTLRVYGASSTSELVTGSPSATISVKGQAGFGEGAAANSRSMSYKFARFNLKDGRVGPVSNTGLTKNVQYTPDLGTTYSDPLVQFNTDNFIKFSGLSANSDEGILVYRSIDSASYKLLAVLGPKDYSGGIWQDYHLFDYTPWGGKNSTDNTYLSVTHFSLGEPVSAQRGWVDVSIKSIDVRSTYFDITLGDSVTDTITTVFCNPSPHTASISHNDTSNINEAIQSRSASGNKSVTLNGKTYIASHISMPDNFGMVGTANITKIQKLAWSGMKGDNADNSLIASQSSSSADSISLYGIDFDGNITNQSLVNDATDGSLNYIIDFGTSPTDVLLDRCRIVKVIGGGIYANSPNSLRLTTCVIKDSGVSDVHPFSPLYATDGDSTIVTSNRFENFADSVDLSVTTEGMVSSNIVKACGSGLLVAGSTFLVSSPNVLIGAANEFLSSPDILNTEYDSINIPLAKFSDAGDFTSDQHVYQENGVAFDLDQTSISGTDGELVYRLNLIQQLNNGSTQPYADTAGPNVSDIQTGPILSFISNDVTTGTNKITIASHGIANGARVTLAGASANALGTGTDGTYFAKIIGNDIELYNTYTRPSTFSSQQAITTQAAGTLQVVPAPSIPLISGKRYMIKQVGNSVNWTSIGAKVGMQNEYFTYNGTTVTGTNGVASAEDFGGLNNQEPPVLTDVSKTPEERNLGQFQFKITAGNKALLYGNSGIFSPAQLQQMYTKRVAEGTAGYPAGSQHVGVAWSANYRYPASIGTIQSGSWYVYQAGPDDNLPSGNVTTNDATLKNSPQYRMIVNNPLNLIDGMEIIINSHASFTISGSYIVGPLYARVTGTPGDIIGSPNQKTVTLTYYNLLGGGDNADAANEAGVDAITAGHLVKGTAGTGTINTIDDFVIAQGLIK